VKTKDVFEEINKHFDACHLAVCSLGRTSEECFNHLPKSQVLFLDCLSSVTETAIGIALGAQSTWVYAFDTDGSFLSNTSSIFTISELENVLHKFTLFIFDNKLLESSGNQKSGSEYVNWKSLFMAWNLQVKMIYTKEELNSFLDKRYSNPKLQIVIININNDDSANTCFKSIDGIESKYLFKRYIDNHINKGIIKPCVKN